MRKFGSMRRSSIYNYMFSLERPIWNCCEDNDMKLDIIYVIEDLLQGDLEI